jgi:Fur family ferric uptake transcriptional regulator
MTDSLKQLKHTLKSHQQSVTKSRQIVFEALIGAEPQTMNHLVAACSGRIDRASVYRTITLFEKLGIVQRLQIGWKYKLELSDSFQHHHHHMTCQQCGRTLPLPEDLQLERRLRALAAGQNFQLSGHQLELQGFCAVCSKLKDPEQKPGSVRKPHTS